MKKKIMKGGGSIGSNFPLYIIIILLASYVTYLLFPTSIASSSCSNGPPINIQQSINTTSKLDYFNDPYRPPVRNDLLYYRNGGLPISIPTQGYPLEYKQIGILTKNEDEKHPLILPLMSRRSTSGSNKYNYYSMSNNGNMNTKLPIKTKGRTCTSEMGCDEVYDGDEVFIVGYKAKFRATIYENNSFDYIA
jgi:hypothetical protein